MKYLTRFAVRGSTSCPIAASVLFVAAPMASAVITAADSFIADGAPNYNVANLVGQGPAVTGFAGNWLAAYGGAQSPSVIGSGLSYTDGTHTIAGSGGSIQYAGGGNGRAGRLLANPYTDATNGSVYFAFLIQLDGVDVNKYRGLELHSGGFDDTTNRKLQIVTGEGAANPLGSDRFTVRLFNVNNNGFAGDLGAGDTNVNLFVGKISLSSVANSDSIQIWRNPSDLSSESLSGAPVFTKSGFDFQADRTSIARFNGTSGCVIDELRFGTAWSDVTTVINTNDSDADGLPDTWELANGLNPNDNGSINPDNGASGNPDNDGLSNIQEYGNYQTDPQNPDTDGDGLNDGADVAAGGSPLDADSDDDLLNDGVEVNTHGTSPINKDTDGDGANDATEVAAGSNPTQSASLPANLRSNVVGIEHFDYLNAPINGLNGGELFDFDNSTVNDAYTGHTGARSTWAAAFGNPVVTYGGLITKNSGATRPFNGAATGGEGIALFDDQSAYQFLYATVDVTRQPGTTWGGLSFMVNGEEEIFLGALTDESSGQRKFGISESGTANSVFSTVVPADGQTYKVVVKLDCFSGVASLWINPNLGQPESTPDAELITNFFTSARGTAVRLASGGTGNSRWDDLVVGLTWGSLLNTGIDSEPDGLRDTWEIAYASDLATLIGSGNNDADTLTNAQEQNLGTDPLFADTDGDTVSDSAEITAGTDPLNPDSDGDGLDEGEEITRGTNPLLVDTDGDNESDGIEVSQGTNPLDPASSSATLGLVILDGTRDAVYGNPVAVQTVNTQFGNNLSEWNAAYAYVKGGRLHLMLTGNLEANFGKFEIFIDSSSAVTTNVLDAAGNDGTNNMNGLTFDSGFSPDYHLIARRGGGNRFDLDMANLATKAFSNHGDVFAGAMEGSSSTTTGPGNASPIGIAYNGSNTAGVTGGDTAADQVAAAAVTTGLELSIALSDLGNPSGIIRIAVMQDGVNHDFLSNQILGGLPAPQGNLAGDGAGNFTGNLAAINFNNFAGDQFFSVTVPAVSNLRITSVQLISGNTQIQFTVEGLETGKNYKVRDSLTLVGFADLPGTQFTATGSSRVITLPVNPNTTAKRFFQVADIP